MLGVKRSLAATRLKFQIFRVERQLLKNLTGSHRPSGDIQGFTLNESCAAFAVGHERLFSRSPLTLHPLRALVGWLKDHIARGELVSVFEQWMPPSRNLFLVYANREHLPSKSIVFIDFFKEKQLEVQSLLADTR